jgi:CelD/BcsL family acetyltransferase involved in cellulose biosynthesis
MTVSIIDVRQDGFWEAAREHPFTSLFSSPLWAEVLVQTYNFKIQALASVQQGRVESAILFSQISDLRGDRVVCLPFCDYCDPLVNDASAWDTLVDRLLAFGVPVTLRCLRNKLPANDHRFVNVAHALWHAVDLTRSEKEIWNGLSGSARQNIRKAARNGVAIREACDADAIREFHRMHCHLRKSKYRLLAQPVAFFERLQEVFGPEGRIVILLAESAGVPVAGIVFLQWGNTLYYKFNASIDTSLCPNDLLAWEGIRLGQRRGLERLDFGLSDCDQPGLIRYKRKFASEESSIATLRWFPPDHIDHRGDLAQETLRRMTELLTRSDVPDEIAAAAGNELYRFFC